MKLYEIAEEYRTALDALATDDTTPAEAIADTLEALDGEFHIKARAVALYARELMVTGQAMAAESAKIKARADRLERRAVALRDYLQRHMQAAGVSEIRDCPIRVKLANNPPRVEILDATRAPPNLMVTPTPPAPRLDLRAALAMLKETKDGAAPWGRIVQNQRLIIGE